MALKGKNRIRVSECSIGDWITLKYQALENKIGCFFDCNKDDQELYVRRISSEDICKSISYTYSTSNYPDYGTSKIPNGTFRAVCVNEIGGGNVSSSFATV